MLWVFPLIIHLLICLCSRGAHPSQLVARNISIRRAQEQEGHCCISGRIF